MSAPALWYSVKRRLQLDSLPRIPEVSWWLVIGGVFIPSLGYWGRWPRKHAALASLGAFLLFLLFFVFLGTEWANWMLGLLLAVHATGLLLLFRIWLIEARLRFRLMLIVALLIGLYGMLYSPFQNFVQEQLFMPLHIRDQVVMVNRTASDRSLKRNDWIVFSYNAARGNQVTMQGGYSASPIYGMPGDHVRFTPHACVVNGVPRPRRDMMPESGELQVPSDRWFVWPEFVVHNRGRASEQEIAQMIMSRAFVAKGDLAGRPFKRWFWRQQILL